MKRFATAVICCALLGACGGAFKSSVRTWAGGPAYKGAVDRVNKDAALDPMSKRLELMSLSGLACTLDEDSGASTAAKQSQACGCSKPTKDSETQSVDCTKWAQAL